MTENITIQDVIQKKPVSMITMESKTFSKCCFNDNYNSVLDILKSGPKTVEEISNLYPQKKSQNTIYRYIKDLIDAGAIIEAGRRIESDKVSTKILYSLSARLFLIEDSSVQIWKSDKGQSLVKTLGLLLNHHFDNKLPRLDRFVELIMNQVQTRGKMRKGLLSVIAEQDPASKDDIKLIGTLETITSLSAKDYYRFLDLLGNLLWLFSVEDLDSINRKLLALFTESSEDETPQNPASARKTQDGEYQDFITYKQDIIQIV
ncbi:MAG: hypothetical protein ACXAEU_15460, partial [Candidatus Hodarchaeales archaeon]